MLFVALIHELSETGNRIVYSENIFPFYMNFTLTLHMRGITISAIYNMCIHTRSSEHTNVNNVIAISIH